MKNSHPFETELATLINKHSLDNECNTPDFILAQYLWGCLLAWTVNTNRRDDWYGISTTGQSRIERGEL